MRVGIDISPITATRTGVGNYCYYLLKSMAALAPEIQFAGFSSGSARVQLGPLKDRVTHRHIPLPTRALYALWAALGSPKVDTFLGGVDVYHATNYVLAPTKRARRVVTIHDLSFLIVPELCSPKIRRIFARGIRGFAHEADAILVYSQSTKNDLVRLLDADPATITVAPIAVDEQFGPIPREQAVAQLAQLYDLRPPFILFVGTLEPRKNVPTVLRAFARLAKEIPHQLVLVGGVGWNAEPIFKTIEELNLNSRVTHVGFVPTYEHLPLFYSAADAFVFPSHYEGFGLPVLEAMACGCPVVTANNSSLPEVAGDAALYAAADDVDGLAQAIRKVLTDLSLSQRLRTRGIDRARTFSWRRCAETTLALYRSLSD